jgi:nucleotide-binding universal stress UspA family protein
MTVSKGRTHAVPFKSVIVATDLSFRAAAALKRAARLPLASHARILILHVQPGDLPPRLRRAAETFIKDRLKRAVRLFQAEAQAAGNPAVRVAGSLATGPAFLEILRHARRSKAELVVLGRHGRTRLRDLMMGTTAQRVVRKSEVPVLVVNTEPTGPYRRALVAVDLEPASRAACELAARVIHPRPTSVSVIHAYMVPFEGWIALSLRGPRERLQQRRRSRDEASQSLRRFLASIADLGLPFKGRIQYGDPRAVVLAEASRRRTDLVVLGTHPRGGLARALLGTVAETVATEARCDVLIARPPIRRAAAGR